jgi:hypothetical protein
MPYTAIEIKTSLETINSIQNKVRDLEALVIKLRFGVSHDESVEVKDEPTILVDFTAAQKTEIEKEIATLTTDIVNLLNTLP